MDIAVKIERFQIKQNILNLKSTLVLRLLSYKIAFNWSLKDIYMPVFWLESSFQTWDSILIFKYNFQYQYKISLKVVENSIIKHTFWPFWLFDIIEVNHQIKKLDLKSFMYVYHIADGITIDQYLIDKNRIGINPRSDL